MNNSFDKKVIFVGGIHGVGKTTLCSEISNKLGVSYYSSSDLILKMEKDNVTTNKKVVNVDKNQNILLESINKYIFREEQYLLDGHFCLINIEGNITDILTSTFEKLNIKSILVLVDDEEKIVDRLSGRDFKEYPTNLIKEFQEQEIKRAYQVAKSIGVECNIIDVKKDIKEILGYINSLL